MGLGHPAPSGVQGQSPWPCLAPHLTPSWSTITGQLATLAGRRLFFVGGAPRSGTTWLQQMLDAHPAVCCRGEGLFLHHLAVPLERMMAERATVIDGKNRELFAHTGGFPQLAAPDVEHLLGTAIVLALARCAAGGDYVAVGEKTPENVFFFPRLQALFPQARFIAIARDPRDVLSSAWHFFGRKMGQEVGPFVDLALPSMVAGTRAMLDFAQANPASCRIVTYEALHADPLPVLRGLFGLLGVPADPDVIAAVVAATSFSAATGGRPAGVAADGAFHRRGVVGDGRASLPPAVNAAIVAALGWSFATFGWSE